MSENPFWILVDGRPDDPPMVFETEQQMDNYVFRNLRSGSEVYGLLCSTMPTNTKQEWVGLAQIDYKPDHSTRSYTKEIRNRTVDGWRVKAS